MKLKALFLTCLASVATISAAALSDKAPAEMEGDILAYDHTKEAAIAKGGVTIKQGKETVLADEVIYLKKQDKLYAKGNIAVLREDGGIYYADILNFENQMHRGRLLSFKARIGKKGLFASHAAEMLDKQHTKLHSIVFSPCKVCKTNFRPFTPLWQMRASEASINLETETIRYKNARIEAHGIPIFYTPYFSTPTPGAKRKTGFLTFGFTKSKATGAAINTPFYLNIAPNKDFTYSPFINVDKKNPTLHALEFRHKLKNGSYQLAGSLMQGEKVSSNGQPRSGKYLYGHINSNGNFHQNSGAFSGDYGFQAQRVRDPSLTYAKRYNLMSEDILTSKLYHRKLENAYYVDSQILAFQDVRPGKYDVTTPNALPFIRAAHQQQLQDIGATMSTELNALRINRLQGTSYNRLSLKSEMKKPIALPYGQLFDLSFKVRGDAYQVDHKAIKNQNAATQNSSGRAGDYGRLYPQLQTQWSYPLINRLPSTSIIIEPVVQFIMSPNKTIDSKIPNEDSQTFEISASNLFSDNRYLGVDLIETGNRLNYGIRGSIDHLLLKKISFLLGQGYHIKKPSYAASSGLADKFSDYVAQLVYEPLNNLEILHRARFDRHSGALNRNEVALLYQHSRWNLMLDYSSASKKATNYSNIYRQEATISTGYNFYDAWWITAKSRRNLGKKPIGTQRAMIENGLGLNYNGECLNIGMEVRRDYTKLKNLVPTTLYLFKIEVPTF